MKKLLRMIFTFTILVLTTISCSSTSSDLLIYMPPEKSPFNITFSYPASWDWKLRPDYMTTTQGAMYTFEPYPASDPTLAEELRVINIDVLVNASPTMEMQEEIDLFLIAVETLKAEILYDKSITIDGHSARWITTKRPPSLRDGEKQPTIMEYVFLLDEDRYYDILLYIPEDEKDGPFHSEFKEMIASIKFIDAWAR